MPELPVPLSSVSLRLAGEVGQTALNQVSVVGAAAAADLDQHIAALRAEIAACREPMIASAQLAGLAAGRSRRALRAAQAQPGPDAPPDRRPGRDQISRDGTGPGRVTCPDVPFVASALRAESVLPLRLLLHYGCGFVEGAVSAGWWPGEAPAGTIEWESMRLAALCELISRAEAAAELHPDLRAIA
jgi:hypothetical protein